jgi:hypothetical protein
MVGRVPQAAVRVFSLHMWVSVLLVDLTLRLTVVSALNGVQFPN